MIRKANLHWRSVNAILMANDKANKMIAMGVEPPAEQDELQDCLLGMLMRDLPEEKNGQFIYDIYAFGEEQCTVECIMKKYFKEQYEKIDEYAG